MIDRIGVLIVDDHAVVRQGLRTFLELEDDVEIVGEASDGEEAVDSVERLLPDIVLMDLVMPRMEGIEAIRRITQISPSTKVIVLTSFADDQRVFGSVEAGAAGYLSKDVLPRELIEAIRTVQRGWVLVHPAIASKLMQEFAQVEHRDTGALLTRRELEVLRLVARGMSNREIAGELALAEKTVKTHVSNILQKLHLADRTQAALYAVREHLADAD